MRITEMYNYYTVTAEIWKCLKESWPRKLFP